MTTLLIDTDVAIDFLNGKNYAKDLIEPYIKTNTAYLSILSVYELYAGMRDKEKDKTKDFIMGCIIEPINLEIAEKAGASYRKYRGKGITLTSVDCLISTTAIVKSHKIATRNKSHYPEKTLLLDF